MTTTEAEEIMSLVKAAVDIWAGHNDSKMGKEMLDAITTP